MSEENKVVVRRFNELVKEYWRMGDAEAFEKSSSPTSYITLRDYRPISRA